MKLLTLLLLLTTVTATAQDRDAEQLEIDRLSQMAAMMPASAEFDDAWQGYVRTFVTSMDEVDTAIERVVDGAREFRGEIRVPGSGSGPAISGRKLRDKLRALAAEVLEAGESGP
jgi:hypothetical protein